MKKLFTLVFLAVSANMAMAQGSQKLIEGYRIFDATLAKFSADGKAHVYLKNVDYDKRTTTFTFYNDDLEKEKDLVVNGEKVTVTNKREELINGEWQLISKDQYDEYYGVNSVDFKDLGSDCQDFKDIQISQTLFNNDSKYEFLMPVFNSEAVKSEWDSNGDGVNDVRETGTNNYVTGFKIVSEDGTTLQTVNFDGGFRGNGSDFYLLKINDKLYLSIRGFIDETEYLLVYTVNSSASNISLARMEKLSSSSVIYDLSGRQTNGHKGINIIRMKNGETKKVFVK